MSVSATNCAGGRAGPSYAIGGYIDVSAGGRTMVMPTQGGYSINLNGTSFASPQVAGIAALLLGLEGALTNDDIDEIIKRTARPMPGLSPIEVGAGWAQADSALSYIAYPRNVNHGDFTSYTTAVDGEGWIWLRDVAGVTQVSGQYDQFYAERYHITSSGTLKNPYPTTALYDAVWARPRASTGWKKIDSTTGFAYDGQANANFAQIEYWDGEDSVTVGTYAYRIYRDAAKTQFVCWRPLRPNGFGDPCPPPSLFKLQVTYLTRADLPPGNRAGNPTVSPDVPTCRFWWSDGKINYAATLPDSSPGTIMLFDVTGRRVWQAELRTPARDHAGTVTDSGSARRTLPSGTYFEGLFVRGRLIAKSNAVTVAR
ncbi:MAG: S8 family serine peptidase [Candidatus Eisenbacteria bacterium]|nr:S8 family serine peptidase [Candidatus Eisenbacteria bacterium]